MQYKETMMGLHLIFWTNRQIRLEGNTEKSELNNNTKSL
jgi:hypothetical protein